MKRIFSILLVTLAITPLTQAQNFLSWKLNDRYFTAQAGIGFSSYLGDLNHTNSFRNRISNVHLGLEARLLSRVAARVEVSHYILEGSDTDAPDSSFAQQRNLSFRSENWEVAVMGIFYMRKYAGDYHKRWPMDPYLLAGVGATFISPTAELAGQTFPLYKVNTEPEDYSRVTLIIPMGAGIKMRINPFINFIGEVSYRFTFSDYLDDVSGNYPENFNELDVTTQLLSNRKDELEGVVNQEAYDALVPGMPRGESSNLDAYMFLNLKLEIFLPPQLFRRN